MRAPRRIVRSALRRRWLLEFERSIFVHRSVCAASRDTSSSRGLAFRPSGSLASAYNKRRPEHSAQGRRDDDWVWTIPLSLSLSRSRSHFAEKRSIKSGADPRSQNFILGDVTSPIQTRPFAVWNIIYGRFLEPRKRQPTWLRNLYACLLKNWEHRFSNRKLLPSMRDCGIYLFAWPSLLTDKNLHYLRFALLPNRMSRNAIRKYKFAKQTLTHKIK